MNRIRAAHRSRRLTAAVACLLAVVLATLVAGCVPADQGGVPRDTVSAQPPSGESSAGGQSPESAPAAGSSVGAQDTAPDVVLKKAVVMRVVDGDTAVMRLLDSAKSERVRFIGVNTPESTTQIEPFGKEASAYTKQKLGGKTVYLETDAELRDKYGRLLAYVWMSKPTLAGPYGEPVFAEIEQRMFNAWLLRDGFAQVMTIPPNVKYVDSFLTLQAEARDAERGLWGLTAESPSAGGAAAVADGASSSGSSASGYVGNLNSKKLHYPDCRSVGQMKESNKIAFASRDAAIAAGYAPCKICRP